MQAGKIFENPNIIPIPSFLKVTRMGKKDPFEKPVDSLDTNKDSISKIVKSTSVDFS